MKKIILFAFLLSSAVTFAQNFIVTLDDGTTDVSNDTVIVQGADATMKKDFHVHNKSAGTMEIMIKRYEVSVVGETKNYFCWSVCYDPIDAGKKPVWFAPNPVTMDAGAIETTFNTYHKHEGHGGRNEYLYVIYDDQNPNDSVFVNVVFENPMYVGVEQFNSSNFDLKASPNPASDLINISYDLNTYSGNNAQIVLVDLLGKKVDQKPIRNQSGRIQLDASNYLPGVYFYSIQLEGQLISTKKLIISK